jgi:LuxR family transcriptional regulator, maltose regulon positive regulatory protein
VDGPLLATKLHAPARRASSIPRPRLVDRLRPRVRLVLVAAPAGFGKTSLLTEWLGSLDADIRVAWLSLDERDDDAAQFWRYLLAAIDVAVPGVVGAASTLLTSGSAPSEAVLATLVNDLHVDGRELVVVLDDLHVIENPAVHAGLAFLVDHLPVNTRLVIASRADPPLPLPRLRVRGDLLELRGADLRFTTSEVASYLRDAMGLPLGADDVAALGDRTEGWIAALQLAALSLQGRSDASAFIAGFAGDDRFVVDYLVEEVLQRQPDDVRDFLLQTSILGRLSGDLCDAVTGVPGSAARLEALERANLFLVPLDDQREWYRYHHLFAEMLRARLLDEQPAAVAGLHARASAWFDRHGETADAILHALDAGAFARAAELIKAAAPAMQQQRREVTLAGWFELLPAEIVRADPELGVTFAGVLLSSGRTDGVERLLADAEAAAGNTSEGILALRRGIALYRAAQSLTRGDLAESLAQSAIAVELAADGSHLDRGSAYGIRGLSLWALGDLGAARATWAVSLDSLERAGHLSDVLGGSVAMVDILVALGRLTDAEEVSRRGLALGISTEPPLRGTADMHVSLAGVLRERGDLAGAREQLAAAEALGEYAGLPQNRHRRRVAAARLLASEGAPDAGIPLLDEALDVYTPDFFPEVRPIGSLRARLLLAAGDLDGARAWTRRPAGGRGYLDEFDAITRARVLLADGGDAVGALDDLLTAAEDGGREVDVVELLVLRALALAAAKRTEEAVTALDRAVTLGEREGFVRVFADEGTPMARLLGALEKRNGATPYLRRLLAAITPPRPATGALLDPLSDRELDVLRYLASELSGPEIARQLFVSLNTLRSHTKSIYAKLGATSRLEALRRATELGLLTRR